MKIESLVHDTMTFFIMHDPSYWCCLPAQPFPLHVILTRCCSWTQRRIPRFITERQSLSTICLIDPLSTHTHTHTHTHSDLQAVWGGTERTLFSTSPADVKEWLISVRRTLGGLSERHCQDLSLWEGVGGCVCVWEGRCLCVGLCGDGCFWMFVFMFFCM